MKSIKQQKRDILKLLKKGKLTFGCEVCIDLRDRYAALIALEEFLMQDPFKCPTCGSILHELVGVDLDRKLVLWLGLCGDPVYTDLERNFVYPEEPAD